MPIRPRLPFAIAVTLLCAACSGAASPRPSSSPSVPPTAVPAATPAPPTAVPPAPATAVPPANVASPAPTSPSGGVATVEGRTFLSIAVDGHGLVPGSQVRLSFEGGQLGISAGCNSMSGGYTIEDGHLLIGNLATTEMACDAALMQQDQWLAAFLDGATLSLDGETLTLANDGATVTLADRHVTDSDRPVDGTTWVLDSLIVGGDAVASIPAGVRASITIADGQVRVETGCNTGTGTVAVSDGALAFGPLALTKMACGADAMSVEQAMLDALTREATYTIDAGTLTVRSGANGLVFKAAP